ncbi:hypothetical protein, partial [Gluconobacter cerinus]
RQSNRQKPEITSQAHQPTVLRSLHLVLITKLAQPGKPLFNIKETRLIHLSASPINAEEMESHRVA